MGEGEGADAREEARELDTLLTVLVAFVLIGGFVLVDVAINKDRRRAWLRVRRWRWIYYAIALLWAAVLAALLWTVFAG